jgi:hypothetical protein
MQERTYIAMQWNTQTHQRMVNLVERVVPEPFRDTALDGLQTDAETSAQQRSATEVEDQDLVRAIGSAPGFIQDELYNTLVNMGVAVERPS